MRIKPCPVCGRLPAIIEAGRIKNYKNGIRRRLCGCKNYHSIIPCEDHLYRSWFEFDGEGDDNRIFKEWNKIVDLYEYNKSLNGYADWDKWKYYKEKD